MSTFFDTNLIVYALDPGAGQRHAIADSLLAQHLLAGSLVISTQVLQETYSVLTRKKGVAPELAFKGLSTFARGTVVPANADFVLRSMAACQRLQLSIRDALIVQAALDAGCDTLLTEDLQTGRRFGPLEVVNPFDPAAHEAAPPWQTGQAAEAVNAPPPPRPRAGTRSVARRSAGQKPG